MPKNNLKDLIKRTKKGRPSFVWQFGQQRRFNLIKKYLDLLDLKDKRILDIGCGVGAYLKAFKEYSDEVYGVDSEERYLKEAVKICQYVKKAIAEKLPFSDNFFDIVLMHEVIEHFDDDQKAIKEAVRVLKPRGNLIIFAPNKWYFFETHGFYWKRKYIFRLIPFINWLPERLRQKFCPHVRVYTKRRIKKLFDNLPVNFKTWHYLYPGFDKIFSRRPILAALFRKIFYFLEKTPLKIFGLSIFVIIEKNNRKL